MSDLIKRADAIKVIEETPFIRRPILPHYIKAKINKIPSAENKGEWIYPTDIIGFGRCNNCKALWDKSLIDNIYFKYCPRCGARMKGADDEEFEEPNYYDPALWE